MIKLKPPSANETYIKLNAIPGTIEIIKKLFIDISAAGKMFIAQRFAVQY